MADYVTVQYTHGHEIRASLSGADGQPVNLIGASVELHVKRVGEAEGSGSVLEADVVGSGPDVRYQWAEGDLNEHGAFLIDWHVSYVDGSTQQFPSDKSLLMIVRQALVTPPNGNGA